MSADNDKADDMLKMMSSCASCGVAECDEIKLNECTNCDLVRYCGDECQENHATQHEEACKKRAAELRDELLFRQPESSYLGDCPICMLPLPLDPAKATVTPCCSKVICNGCDHAIELREYKERCPFCRIPTPSTDQESDKQRMKRVDANDPVAICREGVFQFEDGNYERSFEYFTRATELGYALAHYQLSIMYHNGDGVEKDGGKEMYHLEEAVAVITTLGAILHGTN